jgi:hypothetical protein
MNIDLLIVNDFYSNPDEVRAFALSQEFNVTGNFPGKRTKSFLDQGMKDGIQYTMQFAGKVTDWFENDDYTGSYQLCTANDRTWIHSDYYNMWAGVLYLTPDAPHTSGTALYRYKATGEHRKITKDYEGYDYTKYDKFDIIGNKYNRLILYRGDLFHASLDYFGDNDQNCRLFQTFFFNTEKY